MNTLLSSNIRSSLGNSSMIRKMFEAGNELRKQYGADNVYDFSLGNPSIPAPPALNRSIHEILENESSIRVHGYTSGAGGDLLRNAVAENLNRRFGRHAGPALKLYTG